MELRFASHVIFILALSASSCEKLPSLNDLFGLPPAPVPAVGRRAGAGAAIDNGVAGFPGMDDPSKQELQEEAEFAKHYLDIDSVDMPQFKRSMVALAKQMMKLEHTNIAGVINSTYLRKSSGKIQRATKDDPRAMNVSRRALPHLNTDGEWKRFETRAVPFHVKSKILDAKLTLIYMARHKLRELERHPLFNPKDTSYRMAYVFKRLGKYKVKMTNLWSSMVNNHNEAENWRLYSDHIRGIQGWIEYGISFLITDNYKARLEREKKEAAFRGRWGLPQRFIIYHQKVWKLYTDFMYLWWVLVRLHEAFCRRNHIYITRPPSTTTEPTTTKKEKF